ncbi:MAG: HAD family phosphatase [Bacteroidota bacterium]
MIKAVIFDFDGVIGDTMKDNCIAWQQAFRSYDFNLDATEYYMLEGMGRFQIAQHFIEKYNLDASIKNEVVEAKEVNYKASNTFKIYDHVLDIFALLKQNNIQTAIVTGASKERISLYLSPTIASQLTALVTADDVTHTKPDPEPYIKAVSKLKLNPEDCIVVENAILGIKSAKAANCKCFALETTLTKDYLSQADEIFATHKELLTKFETILK